MDDSWCCHFLATNWTLDVTSSEPFCISCHEMRDNAWPELQETIHFSNSTGIRADCADCHVPHTTFGKIARKIEALRELYGKITGIIDAPEKYEAHRLPRTELMVKPLPTALVVD